MYLHQMLAIFQGNKRNYRSDGVLFDRFQQVEQRNAIILHLSDFIHGSSPFFHAIVSSL